MEGLKLLLMGAIQGITELLPISSTGHILILGKIIDVGNISSSLLVLFHLGSTVAILLFFWKKLFKNFFTKQKWDFYLKIIVATIPAAIAGFLLNELIEQRLRDKSIIALSFIVWGIVMIVLERKKKNKLPKVKNVEGITWKQAIITGLAQVIALIPGTSRSGITTIAGIFSGLEKYVALEFSFILSVPILMGSFLWFILKHSISETILATGISSAPVGFAIIFFSSLIFGLLTLHFLKKVQKKNWLTFFGVYRIFLGIVLLFIF